MSRLAVPKTYKLFIGGAFVRSESGRYDRAGDFNIPRASRKDVRDAVAAARRAFGPWAARTAYNRFDPTAAFGGYKESGFGREGGPAGLLPYVRLT